MQFAQVGILKRKSPCYVDNQRERAFFMNKNAAVKNQNEAVSYSFSETQIKNIQAVRKEFNNFTGENYNLAQFIDFMINDAIYSEIKACNEAIKITHGMPRFASQQIKPIQTVQ